MKTQLLLKITYLDGLAPNQKLILLIMAANITPTNRCNLTRPEIAHLTGLCLRGVAIGLQELSDRGLVKITGKSIQITLGEVASFSNPVVKTSRVYSPEFDEWWAIYPRKKNASKLMACKSFGNAIATGAITFAKLMEKTRLFCTEVKDKDATFIPYPTTWLNQRRWDTVEETDSKKRENLNHCAG